MKMHASEVCMGVKTENFPKINQDENAHIGSAHCEPRKITIEKKWLRVITRFKHG